MVYNVLVVGAGGHSLHWRNQMGIHGEFKPSGVVDINPDVLDNAPDVWGVAEDAVATTIEGALNLGVAADVALVCSPIDTHHGLAIEALRQGLHVICEKNMAHSMQAGREMTRCALEHPKLATAVGHQYPYWRPANWAIRKAIGTGQLGKLDSIDCNFAGSGFWGPGSPTRAGWRRFLDHDYLEDWAVHTLDLFRYFTAMDAVTISADLWRPHWSRRYGTTSINVRMQMAPRASYEGEEPLVHTQATEDARRRWRNGRIPDDWVRAQYLGHAETMGLFELGEHWRIQGSRGSIEFSEGRDRRAGIRMFTHDRNLDATPATDLHPEDPLQWTESNLAPYPTDLECGPAAQWRGDNTEEEFDNNCLILEQVKQCIESGGTIKPARCFESTLKTLAIVMGAIQSSQRGGEPVFLPDLWEV
jgi:predicted dehydrogenase